MNTGMVDSWANKNAGKKVTSDMLPDAPLDADLLEKEVVILVQAKNFFGDNVFSYVQLTFSNLNQMMKKMVTNESFLPSDYGTVLAAGRGDPSDELKEEMRTTYNLVDIPQTTTPVGTASSNAAPKAAASKTAATVQPKPVVKPAISQPKFFDDNE
jgi:hypothetical protein